jgi:hypothetical protein
MKSRHRFLLFFFIAFRVFGVEIIEAPFVSKINFEVSKRKVLLNWQNPSDFSQFISIYRSNLIIDSANKLTQSEKIAVLKSGEEKYIDSPLEDGEYYYAVLITNKAKNDNSVIFVPYRNFTIKPAVIVTEDIFEVTSLSAASKNTYVKLEWNFKTESSANKNIVIYRNTKPIKDNDFLNSSIKITSTDIKNRSFIDVPLPHFEYYYAAFVEEEKDKKFLPDINITLNPVSIEEQNELFPEFSVDNFIPLPLIILQNDPKTDKMFSEPQVLKNPKKIQYNDNVKEIINNIRISYSDVFNQFMKENEKNLLKLNFHILYNEDIFEVKEYSSEYKSALLYIQNKDYDKAQKILEELIREIMPDELLSRVSFYLGQIYYLKGNNYMAYLYFVYSYNSFKKEISPYLSSIYQQIFKSLD